MQFPIWTGNLIETSQAGTVRSLIEPSARLVDERSRREIAFNGSVVALMTQENTRQYIFKDAPQITPFCSESCFRLMNFPEQDFR